MLVTRENTAGNMDVITSDAKAEVILSYLFVLGKMTSYKVIYYNRNMSGTIDSILISSDYESYRVNFIWRPRHDRFMS